MTKWLIGRFVRCADQTDDPDVRASYGTLAAAVGIIVNLFLAASKFVLGLLSGSLAIMADAANNLSDAAASIVTMITVRLARKPVDPEHPFGHGRMEYLGSLAVGALIVAMGLSLLRDAFGAIFHPELPQFSAVVLVILAIGVLGKLWLYSFYRKTASAIHSGTLDAAAKDCLGDALSTGAVLVSLGAARLFGWAIDGWVGLAVSAIVLKAGFEVCRNTVDSLLGGKPDPERVDQIRRLLLAHEGILGLHDLVVHDYGPGRCLASVHAEVSAECDIVAIHEVIDAAEREIAETLRMPICIHMDPIVTTDETSLRLQSQIRDFLRSVDPSLSMHDFRMVPGENQTNLIFDCVLPVHYTSRDTLLHALEAYVQTLDSRYRLIVQFDTDFT